MTTTSLPPNVITLQDDTYTSLLNKLRDRSLPSPQVRTLVRSLTTIIAKTLNIQPLEDGEAIAVIIVLRSGLAMFDPFMEQLPPSSADTATTYHMGIFRDKVTLQPVEYYNKLPPKPAAIKRAFVLDPLIATGGTVSSVVNIVKLVLFSFFLFFPFFQFSNMPNQRLGRRICQLRLTLGQCEGHNESCQRMAR